LQPKNSLKNQINEKQSKNSSELYVIRIFYLLDLARFEFNEWLVSDEDKEANPKDKQVDVNRPSSLFHPVRSQLTQVSFVDFCD
jgi:hypothetical protein